MVGATEVIRETGIPRTTLYRLVEDRKIPAHHERKPWQTRGRLRFRMSEVRKALAELEAAPPPADPPARPTDAG